MKIIKVSNCGECQYKGYIDLTGTSILSNYNYCRYCRYRFILTGEIKKIENLEVIAEWCDLDDYEEIILRR